MGYLIDIARKINTQHGDLFPYHYENDERNEYINVDIGTLRGGRSQSLISKAVCSQISTPPIVNAIWVNPFPQGSIQSKRESLLEVMAAISKKSLDRVALIWPRGYASTQEIRTSELEIARIQSLVLSGKVKLANFRKAVESWEQIVLKD